MAKLEIKTYIADPGWGDKLKSSMAIEFSKMSVGYTITVSPDDAPYEVKEITDTSVTLTRGRDLELHTLKLGGAEVQIDRFSPPSDHIDWIYRFTAQVVE